VTDTAGARTLTATSLAKTYPTPREPLVVIDDVSLAVGPGESVAIMGPSGCGKSTLLYMLGALEPPSAGTVTLDGTNPYALGERDQAVFRGRHIGFVFQEHLLLPQLSAVDNVLAPTIAAADRDASAPARARQLLGDVGLADRRDHRPAELSGGERQRVAIARALIRQPLLLLCDEPTGNLDSAASAAVADLLVSLHRERQTILVVVTHSATLAERFDRRYELTDRRLRPAS
jgi:lipoprotein-releasing system ATP-binding protein